MGMPPLCSGSSHSMFTVVVVTSPMNRSSGTAGTSWVVADPASRPGPSPAPLTADTLMCFSMYACGKWSSSMR